MNLRLRVFKQAVTVAVPISLVFSIYLNSLVSILFICTFIPDVIKNFSKNNTKKNRNIFLVLIAFIGTYLLGFFLDTTYGIVNIKKAERLLPFLIFPFVFIYSNIESYFKDLRNPLRVFSFFIVLFNIFLIVNLFIKTSITYTDTSFLNKRWVKRNVILLSSDESPSNLHLQTNLLKPDGGTNPSELLYNRFFTVDKDTAITRSIFIKSSDDIWLLMRHYDGSRNKGAWFFPKEGKVGFIQEGLKANVESYDKGWYRISLTNRVDHRLKRERIQLTFVSENKSYNFKINKDYKVLIGGAQLEIGSKAGDYMPLRHRGFWEEFNRVDILGVVEGHPTYYSLYVVFSSLIILLFYPFKKAQLFCLGINIATIVLLGSKAAIFTVFILLLILSYYSFKKGVSRRNAGMAFLAVLSGISLLYFTKTFHRFYQMFSSLGKEGSGFFLSTEKRLLMWDTIKNLPIEMLLIGNGNIHGYQIIGKELSVSLNAHNQYLEALLCSGIIGFLLLLTYIFGIFTVDKTTRKNILILLFVLMLAFNLLFENLLNRQWGIVFISFFFSYLYVFHRKSSRIKSKR